MNKSLNEFASKVAGMAGRPQALLLAIATVSAWTAVAWLLALSGVWELAGHAVSSILLLLIVLLIRHAHQRQVKEIHRRLDELARDARRKQERTVSLADLSDEDLKRLQRKVQRLRERKIKSRENGRGQHGPQEGRRSWRPD